MSSAASSGDVVALADAMNQFAMRVEDFAYRWQISADARLADKERERWGDLFRAARDMREEIAKVLPE